MLQLIFAAPSGLKNKSLYGWRHQGNKTYEHFNAMAKFVDEKFQSLGGHRIHPLGLGDDDANLVTTS
jgi:sulfite reductase alpha subunit-like flavoprotein